MSKAANDVVSLVRKPDDVTQQRKALAQVALLAIDDTLERLAKIRNSERNRSPDQKTVQLATNFIRGADLLFDEETLPVPKFNNSDDVGLYIVDRAKDRAYDVCDRLLTMRFFVKEILVFKRILDFEAQKIHEILDDIRQINMPIIMLLRYMGDE